MYGLTVRQDGAVVRYCVPWTFYIFSGVVSFQWSQSDISFIRTITRNLVNGHPVSDDGPRVAIIECIPHKLNGEGMGLVSIA